jgi:hypothetical protein
MARGDLYRQALLHLSLGRLHIPCDASHAVIINTAADQHPRYQAFHQPAPCAMSSALPSRGHATSILHDAAHQSEAASAGLRKMSQAEAKGAMQSRLMPVLILIVLVRRHSSGVHAMC